VLSLVSMGLVFRSRSSWSISVLPSCAALCSGGVSGACGGSAPTAQACTGIPVKRGGARHECVG